MKMMILGRRMLLRALPSLAAPVLDLFSRVMYCTYVSGDTRWLLTTPERSVHVFINDGVVYKCCKKGMKPFRFIK